MSSAQRTFAGCYNTHFLLPVSRICCKSTTFPLKSISPFLPILLLTSLMSSTDDATFEWGAIPVPLSRLPKWHIQTH